MSVRICLIALGLAFALAACGVKSDLRPPPGAIEQKNEQDPSKPPNPIGD
jgi:hypothetical protein